MILITYLLLTYITYLYLNNRLTSSVAILLISISYYLLQYHRMC